MIAAGNVAYRGGAYLAAPASGIRYRVDPDGPGGAPFGAYTVITDVSGDDEGDFGGTTADTVTLVPVPDPLPASAIVEVQFQVVIQ